jgi:hypothetical protein
MATINLTLSIPVELRKEMEQFPEVNWSALMKRLLQSQVKKLILKEQLLKQLESEKEFDAEALRIGDEIKEAVWKKYKQQGW